MKNNKHTAVIIALITIPYLKNTTSEVANLKKVLDAQSGLLERLVI
jgi:hypothetical protein